MEVRCVEILRRGFLRSPFPSGCFFSAPSESTSCPVTRNPMLQLYHSHKGSAQAGSGKRRILHFCRAQFAAKGGVGEYDYDLYELLGLESDASQNDIRSAYRWLQKRCHPDIVGEAGHDMSILLNDAYAVLSDPNRRALYDEVRKDTAEFDGFTGEPLYSVWYGSPDEQQAVFVDESRCIGCLKCALLAPNTFAIENRYGRARAVRQWGDSEVTIKDACRSCPVDCIWWVDRSKLPALEFVMSKQIRGPVGVDVSSNGGVRSENVFVAADKFMLRHERREQQKAAASQETASQRAARMAAADGVRARGGRWWHHWVGKKPTHDGHSSKNWSSDSAATHSFKGALVHVSWSASGKKSSKELPADSLHALHTAAAQRRRDGKVARSEDEYWVPHEPTSSSPFPYAKKASTGTAPPADDGETGGGGQFNRTWTVGGSGTREEEANRGIAGMKWNWVGDLDTEGTLDAAYKSFLTGVPIAFSSLAAGVVAMTNGTHPALSQTQITGPLPADVTTSLPMQMFLAATVWYVVGSGVSAVLLCGALGVVRMRDESSR